MQRKMCFVSHYHAILLVFWFEGIMGKTIVHEQKGSLEGDWVS